MLLVKNLTRRKFDERFLRKVEKRCLKEIGIKNEAPQTHARGISNFLGGAESAEAGKKPHLLKDLQTRVSAKADKTEISLVICGEKKIKNLNRFYRKKDKITDVLSFGDQKSDFIAAPDGTLRLGEIFICYPVAERQAQKAGHSLEKEMAVLLVHGILHLAGHNHEKSAREAKKMFKLQKKIIAKIFKK